MRRLAKSWVQYYGLGWLMYTEEIHKIEEEERGTNGKRAFVPWNGAMIGMRGSRGRGGMAGGMGNASKRPRGKDKDKDKEKEDDAEEKLDELMEQIKKCEEVGIISHGC